jgi:hypothetical protein
MVSDTGLILLDRQPAEKPHGAFSTCVRSIMAEFPPGNKLARIIHKPPAATADMAVLLAELEAL